jgi:ABC-type multidrug transport system fused ATPase/permease subunit
LNGLRAFYLSLLIFFADELGEIVERGTHEELYRLGKVYKSLVDGSHDLS